MISNNLKMAILRVNSFVNNTVNTIFERSMIAMEASESSTTSMLHVDQN